MSKKDKNDKHGFVYSTDPNFHFQHEEDAAAHTLPPQQQKMRIRMETKHRGGKTATVIGSFVGKQEDLEDLGKKLKNYCGTGGSVKDGEIIIQGDQREKLLLWFRKNGYTNTK
jgi:translation initiation factor 1